MLTSIERQAFKNYFWTVQLIAGLSMAGKLFVAEGIVGALFGFVSVLPVSALGAWLRVRWERTHTPDTNPRMPSRRFVTISVTIVVAAVAFALWYDYG